ncbi:MAG TPA: 30S ribosomal protein S17 [Candidatus Azosocius sp. HAIN]
MKNENKLKSLRGIVVKKTFKTIIVKIEKKILHNVYKKVIKKFTKFHVHDPENLCKEGDIVFIKESIPYSKTKSWLLLRIFNKN